jgi:hypothetical protein
MCSHPANSPGDLASIPRRSFEELAVHAKIDSSVERAMI